MQGDVGRGKAKAERNVKVVDGDVVRGNAGRNLLHPLTMMDRKQGAPMRRPSPLPDNSGASPTSDQKRLEASGRSATRKATILPPNRHLSTSCPG
jgi:hypothetical protein